MVWTFLASGLTGILSGFGVGGGSLLMLYLLYVQQLEQHTAQCINLLYFIPCALASLCFHLRNRMIELRVLLPCIAAGIVTCAAGSLLAQTLETGLLRRVFGIFLLIIGIRELLQTRKPQDSG